VTDKDHDQTSDEVTGETTSAFPSAKFLNEPGALPTAAAAASAVSGVEALPQGSALIVRETGPHPYQLRPPGLLRRAAAAGVATRHRSQQHQQAAAGTGQEQHQHQG
jgi:hypothetical protein